MGDTHALSIYRTTPPPSPAAGNFIHRGRQSLLLSRPTTHLLHHPFPLRAVSNESNGSERGGVERSEADRMVDAMDFGELCNEFECFSSPQVESTARQLARDILQLSQPNFPLASSVIYKDPVRSFRGRDKYKRPLWVSGALENPSVTVEEMEMLSTSVLSIKWTMRGRPKWLTSGGEELIVKVSSQFTLNQISGQVIEHQEVWDLSASSSIAQLFFWTSCRLLATIDTTKDLGDLVKGFSSQKPDVDTYPQPSVDPTKFFQSEDSFQRDAYQFVFFVALVYFVVQLLRTTL
ncbi:uncharacterized protein LOC110816377 [Carica papaya]|uniref:uncharacterized protein LOC110816377 n=1 Tax=Carica papaya TaxID=3649 RepID=UPI000B8D041B|nr:uncharacterized protein LOC110816377 [Carica papaya]